jgi:hypothetical protein
MSTPVLEPSAAVPFLVRDALNRGGQACGCRSAVQQARQLSKTRSSIICDAVLASTQSKDAVFQLCGCAACDMLYLLRELRLVDTADALTSCSLFTLSGASYYRAIY